MSKHAPYKKEMRQLVRRFEPGYTTERDGSGHFRILDPDGQYVRSDSGRRIRLAATPLCGAHPGIIAQLRKAGVIE